MSTEDLAAHFGIDTTYMLKRMQRLARAGKVKKVRDIVSRKSGRVVGWQKWEMYWDPENDPYV